MSQENVEIVGAMYGAWERGEESWVALLDPEVEWDFSAYPLPDVADTGKGLDDFLGFLVDYVGSWAAYQASGSEFIDAGDKVVVVFHETIRATGSDVPIERDLFPVVSVREGKVARIASFRTRQEALEAAGLQE